MPEGFRRTGPSSQITRKNWLDFSAKNENHIFLCILNFENGLPKVSWHLKWLAKKCFRLAGNGYDVTSGLGVAPPELGVAFPESEDFLGTGFGQIGGKFEPKNPNSGTKEPPTPHQRSQGTGGPVDQKPGGPGTQGTRNPGDQEPGWR